MVSIIIPTRNRAVYLKKTIANILEQTYLDFEVLILDNSDGDETELVVKSFNDNRLLYIVTPKFNNIGKIRNFGIENSNFDLIAFCDDDDLWVKDKLEVQLKLANNYPIICSLASHIDNDDNFLYSNNLFKLKSDFIINRKLLAFENLILQSSLLIRKSILLEFNCYKELPYSEDYELWLRISKKYNFYIINKELVKMRIHDTGLSRELNTNLKTKYNALLFKIQYLNLKNESFKLEFKSGIFKINSEIVILKLRNKIYNILPEIKVFMKIMFDPRIYFFLFYKKFFTHKYYFKATGFKIN